MQARPRRRPLLAENMTHLERNRVVKHEGKIRYSSMGEARDAAKKFRKRYGPKTKPYACKYEEHGQGVHYHIGHDTNARRRAKVRRIVVRYKEQE